MTSNNTTLLTELDEFFNPASTPTKVVLRTASTKTEKVIERAKRQWIKEHFKKAKQCAVCVAGTEIYACITKAEAKRIMKRMGEGNYRFDYRSFSSTLFVEANY